MKYALPVFLLLVFVRANAHDLQISLFELGRNDQGEISLFIRLDKEDILKELYDHCEDYGQVNQCLEDYINKHFQLQLGETKPNFQLTALKHTKEFVEANLHSSISILKVDRIDVFNDVLVASKPAQENIVRFSFNDQFRSFRMNKDRINTTVTYN